MRTKPRRRYGLRPSARPGTVRKARLKAMLAMITSENMPNEKEPFGKRVGKELL
ncbi:MAG TPA: hypothetical protein VEV38_07840 [Candidatus Eremiobacteraceae bacterium]|nr:hypothetical protein [Candidatus Eremiobacteraceae bacterium]